MGAKWIAAVALTVAATACGRGSVVETGPTPGAQPGPPPATARVVPAGTVLNVRLNQRLSTESNRVGDRFTATVTSPLVAANGQVAIPAGATLTGTVTGLHSGRRAVEPAAIRLDFDRISFGNRSYPFEADVVDTDVRTRQSRSEIAERAAIGAAAGAVLGAVIGGDLRDILIGGALGAGAGTIISLGWGDVEAVLPANTVMSVRTTQQLSLR